MLAMLGRPEGATVAAIMRATHWCRCAAFCPRGAQKSWGSIFAPRRATVIGFIVSCPLIVLPAHAAMLGLIPPSTGHVSLMPRVKIGPAPPGRGTVAVEIAQLRDLDIGELRNRWHAVFGRQPPVHLPRHLLFRVLAYRLQADHFGDLDSEYQRLLDRSESDRSPFPAPARCRAEARPPRPLQVRGTVVPLPRGWPRALLGTARPIPACRKSPWLLPVPGGTVLSSSASAQGRRKVRQHEERISEAGSAARSIPGSQLTKG